MPEQRDRATARLSGTRRTNPPRRLGVVVNLRRRLEAIGRSARDASEELRLAPAEQRSRAIVAMADQLRRRSADILAANAEDVAAASRMVDRLLLDDRRIEAMACAVGQIAELPDPVGKVMDHWTRPNGLENSRARTPIGGIGMIFENRPDRTTDT